MRSLVAAVLVALTIEVEIYVLNVPVHTRVAQLTSAEAFTVPATPSVLRRVTTVGFICAIGAVQSVVRISDGSICNESASAALIRTWLGHD